MLAEHRAHCRNQERSSAQWLTTAMIGAILWILLVPASTAWASQASSPPRNVEPIGDLALHCIDNFLREHGRLPQYEEIAVLPSQAAKDVLHVLPPENKATFWRRHLESFLATDLQPEQQTALQQAIARLTPDFFERLEEREASQVPVELRQLHGSLSEVFSPPEVAAMLSPNFRPSSESRSALQQLSPDDQIELWRQHLLAFLQQDLAEEERDAILEASELLTPDLFARDGRSLQDLRTIHEVLSNAFSAPEVSALLSPPLSAVQPGVVSAATEEEPLECGCNAGWPDECGGFSTVICVAGNGRCEVKSWGCGPFFFLECNGGCCFKSLEGELFCPW